MRASFTFQIDLVFVLFVMLVYNMAHRKIKQVSFHGGKNFIDRYWLLSCFILRGVR